MKDVSKVTRQYHSGVQGGETLPRPQTGPVPKRMMKPSESHQPRSIKDVSNVVREYHGRAAGTEPLPPNWSGAVAVRKMSRKGR